MKRNTDTNKTQCQLCKRLAGPIFPLSWSHMFWERVSTMDLIAKGQLRKNHFPENCAIFGVVTNNRTLCCLWISKCKTSGVPFDDSRALLHCWGLGNSIGITNSHAAITNHSQKLLFTYMSTSARWSGVLFDNSMALLQDWGLRTRKLHGNHFGETLLKKWMIVILESCTWSQVSEVCKCEL